MKWATHCDTEIRFFDTEQQAIDHACDEIDVCRREANDGWQEEVAESICVMKVVLVARKVDPNADYRCVNYSLQEAE